MSKILVENKRGKITITNKLSYPETVNERVYNAITKGMFEGFLSVSVIQKRKETLIECTAQGLLPLTSYFNGLVTKKMFLDFVYQVIVLVKNCDKNMINANNIEWQADKIFIEPQSKAVKCIFWPVVNNQRDAAPYVFLKELPYKLKFNPHEDSSYLEQYKAFFNSVPPFSVNSFERLILKLQGKTTPGNMHVPSGILSGKLSYEKKQAQSNLNVQKEASIEYDPFSQSGIEKEENNKERVQGEQFKFCSSCGFKNKANANFCIKCGTALQQRQEEPKKSEPSIPPVGEDLNDSGTTVLGDDFGGTTVLGFDEPEEPIYPILTRLRNGESFVINKPTYRIGKEQRYCDLFICDNSYISRSHADILTRDDRYYIIDRNSTNRTFVDGKVIPVEREVEIFPGTAIRLANEDFTFDIEV